MKKILAFWCLFSIQKTQGQAFGGYPSGLQWRQITTNAARVIFPKGLDSLANRVATLTYNIYSNYSATVGSKHRQVSIVLQSNNTISNAFVQLGPYHSEFFVTTPQNPFQLGSLGWADNLSIHEFRHVQQYSNYRVGFSKVASFLLGENGQALANALSIPDWFFEGDAVWNETALSNQGRGRLPQFFNGYKSIFYQNKRYSWMKLRNGSFKNYVPNHYDLGYLLVAYAREKYGDSVWVNITQDAAKFKAVFYPLQKSIQKNIGMCYQKFRSDALAYYNAQWLAEKKEEPQWISKHATNTVVNYEYVYPQKDGSMIALKSGYEQIPTFIRLKKNGEEEKIGVKNIGVDDYYSYNDGFIIYSSFRADRRWGNKDYNNVSVLEVATKKEQIIGTKTKYFSPDISIATKSIIAVDADPTKACMLHLLTLQGEIIQKFTKDSTLFYSHPKFSKDGASIYVAARQPDGEMGLLEWRIANNQTRWLIAPGNRIIGFPVVMSDTIFFTMSAAGSDALYQITLPDKSPTKLASYPTGIYQGFAQNNKIVGSTFTTTGYRVAAFAIENQGQGSAFFGNETLKPLYVTNTYARQKILTQIVSEKFASTKYKKATGLFNFHSWQPEIDNVNYTFAVLGNNVLNNFSSRLSYTYNTNEQSNKIRYSGIYGGWYVEPYLSVSKTWGRAAALNKDTTVFYNENEAGFGFQLPLNFSFGKRYRYLSLNTAINTQQVRWTGLGKKLLTNLDFNYFNARLSYTSQTQTAKAQIFPHFAHAILADYRTIVTKYKARQLLLNAALYLPGIGATHSFVITTAYQARDTFQQYIFSNAFPFSRGYSAVNFPRQWRVGGNYHFPISYPEWGFGNIIYFKRLRANLFYDYTVGKSLRTKNTFAFASAGSEFFLDMRAWNQLPITIGFRYSRLLNNQFRGSTQPNQFEIILPVNLY